MPLRGTSRAPRFEGDPQELQQYFEDVELLCEDAQLFADEDRIRWAVRYACREDAVMVAYLISLHLILSARLSYLISALILSLTLSMAVA